MVEWWRLVLLEDLCLASYNGRGRSSALRKCDNGMEMGERGTELWFSLLKWVEDILCFLSCLHLRKTIVAPCVRVVRGFKG